MKELIKSRRTIRKFSQEPIPEEKLTSYVEAARVAPSGANLQPLKYIVVSSAEMSNRMFPQVKWAGYLAPEYNPKDDERPTAYIVVCADTEIRKNGYEIDVGASVENIILSALSDGVGACWMAAIDRDEIRKLLEIPERMEIPCLVALGYPKESPKEVDVTTDIKYYLENETLCVPKRSMEEVLIKRV